MFAIRFADRAALPSRARSSTRWVLVRVVGRRGIEPRTIGLKVRCSAN
jgi:hypothetical protein